MGMPLRSKMTSGVLAASGVHSAKAMGGRSLAGVILA